MNSYKHLTNWASRGGICRHQLGCGVHRKAGCILEAPSLPLGLLRMWVVTMVMTFFMIFASSSIAQERPVLSTPWDDHSVPDRVIIRLGDYNESVGVDSTGSGEGEPVFFCTGLPPGLTQDKTTGVISGTTTRVGIYTVSARVAYGTLSSLPVTRRIAVLPHHVPTPGIYERALPYEDIRPLGGHLTINLQPSGAYSGLLRLGNKNVSVAGVLNHVPDSPSAGLSSTSFPLRGADDRVFRAMLTSDHTNTLFLKLEDRETGAEFTSYPLLLVRPAVGYVPPCPQTGRHAIVVTSGSVGLGSMQVGADYRLTFVGQTPDGRGVTASHWLFPVDDAVVGQLYAGNGVNTAVMGGFNLPGDSNPGYPSDLGWVRLPQRGRLYPDGVAEGLSFLSSRTDAARVASTFPGGGARIEIESASSGGAMLVLFQFNRQMRAIFGTGTENPLRTRLDVYTPTGFFTGQFTLRDPDPNNPGRIIVRPVNFRGLFLPEHGMAMGNFLVPELPSDQVLPRPTMATTPIVPGFVKIVSNSPE